MSEFAGRDWAAFRDGEMILQVTGPDGEGMCREVGERACYREWQKPTVKNGWSLHGPWIDVDDLPPGSDPPPHPGGKDEGG